MTNLGLHFDQDSFCKLFPFYIQIDTDLKILNFGKSLSKTCTAIQTNDFFFSHFTLQRPHLKSSNIEEIKKYCNDYVVIVYLKTNTSYRGQFINMNESILFVGTPWFTSMNDVMDNKLTFEDFAHHDPLLDLLHVLNNAENTSKELKELLTTINKQKNELKKDKEELNRLSYVASANKNGVVFTKLDGTIFWCNDSFLKLTGYTEEEVLGKSPIEIGSTEFTSKIEIRKMLSSFYNGEAFEAELLFSRKNMPPFWSRVKGQPIKDANGVATQFFAIIEDISLKKRYDERLELEKEKYRNIIANMNLGLLEVSLDGTITMVNQSFVEMSGCSIEELIGSKIDGRFLTSESSKILEAKSELRNQGISDSYQVKVLDKNKVKKTWLISGAPSYNINGDIIGSIGIHLDITEQKEQEEQLYLLSLIAEKNINAVIICNEKGEIEWVNTSFLNMSGYQEEEVVGRKPGRLLQGKETNPETIAYMKEQIEKGLPFNCEIINYSKSKNKYWVRIQGQALYNKSGEIIKFFAIEEDITAQKELEAQKENLLIDLAKTNKELEDYAQIVSHDLKSPLRSINSLIAWIKEENEASFDDQTQKYFNLIGNKVEKMDHLIEGILTYSKIDKEEVKQESVDVNEIVSSIIEIIHIPKHITISIQNKLPVIPADRFRIQQLFQNLIGNAVNYIDKKDGYVHISSLEFETYHVFSIKDNGVGMHKDIHEKIFETFKTFTNSKHSTGLGLSIVKKIVNLYKGQIWLESEENKGTTFFIKLNK